MTTLLASSTATNAAATEGDVKTFLTNLRDYIADTLGTDSTNKGAIAGLLGSLLHGKVDKSGAYTVVAADRGKVINATGTWTLSLTAAATLGDGFTFAIRNVGTGAITIDPNLSEQIAGATTYVINPGNFVIVYCDGAGFSLVGGRVNSFNSRTGDVSLSSTDVTAALGFTPAKNDFGVGAWPIGVCLVGRPTGYDAAAGSTRAYSDVDWTVTLVNSSAAPTAGTWRNIGNACTTAGLGSTLWQRVS